MPRQANGQYLPPANTAAVTGTTISSTAYNSLEGDIGNEITNSVDRLGRSAMQADLPMGGNKVTGAADPVASTDLATKNYIDTAIAAFFSTGDAKITLKTTADTGWVMCNDGTIGSASSGASTRANADTQALFTLLFNNVSDTAAPILTSGGGATTRSAQVSASAAWAANCRMSLTKVLGRAIAIAGSGAGLSSRSLGDNLGSSSLLITQSQLPNVTLGANVSGSIAVITDRSDIVAAPGGIGNNNLNGTGPGTFGVLANASTSGIGAINSSGTANLNGSTSSINGNQAQAQLDKMNPTSYWNVMVKL